QPVYDADLAAVRKTWVGLPEERRALLRLLSRFSLSPDQAYRWYHAIERDKGTSAAVADGEVLANPYRICGPDLGHGVEPPIPIGTSDRGLLPDDTIASRHPVPAPSNVGSPNDPRRLRAGLVSVLRAAAISGDTLLSAAEAIERVAGLELTPAC